MLTLVFLALFTTLLFLSRVLTTTISLFFYRVTKSYQSAVWLLAVLFLPGVIIHELGHWLLANLLFVPTGDIEFLPQVRGDVVKLGSVQVAKTDFIRRFIIGIAPILFGAAILLSLFWFLSPPLFPITWKTILFLYSTFEIGNTMFSSRKDLEGALVFGIFIFLLMTLFHFLKVPIFGFSFLLLQSPVFQSLFHILSQFFSYAIGIDAIVIGLCYAAMKVLRK